MYNIVYKGQVLHQNLSIEECAQILEEYATDFYEKSNINPSELKMEAV